jgi:hypothetical protein
LRRSDARQASFDRVTIELIASEAKAFGDIGVVGISFVEVLIWTSTSPG